MQQPPTDKKNLPTAEPGPRDIWTVLTEVRDRVTAIENELVNHNQAFPINDLGHPDYDGHRKTHTALNRAGAAMESYKIEITKKIITVVLIFLLGLMGSGFLDWVRNSTKPSEKDNAENSTSFRP